MENQRRNQVEIEMYDVLANVKPVFTTKCCIYRVPHQIRNLNPGAYTPNIVSIGPFHYGNDNLLSMESLKQFYCREFVERAAKVWTPYEYLMRYVHELEPNVRDYYSHDIKLTPQELVKVIFVDCGFIFELFLRYYFKQWTDDAIRSTPWLVNGIHLDLVLLENQLPFFVLEKLYNLVFRSSQIDSEPKYPSFLELTFDFFYYYFNKLGLSAADDAVTSIEHFADLLRTFHLQPSNQRPLRLPEIIPHFNSVTELNEAGVALEVDKQSHCLLNLEWFRGHPLKIPEIKVMDQTETLFRNMVALEQCHYPDHSYVTDYVAFLSFLIKTGEDVDLLVKNRIIVNWLGDSDTVAKLFNGLLKNITRVDFNHNYFIICRELGEAWARYTRKATLKRVYFNTPLEKLASFAAILVIFLTIIQTICSILQVV